MSEEKKYPRTFVAVWWHCLLQLFRVVKWKKGESHRMCYIKWAGDWKKRHYCSCDPEFQAELNKWEEMYVPISTPTPLKGEIK